MAPDEQDEEMCTPMLPLTPPADVPFPIDIPLEAPAR
jgi:hypothetical protein